MGVYVGTTVFFFVTGYCVLYARGGCMPQNPQVPNSSSNATGSVLQNGTVLMIKCNAGYGGIGDAFYRCIHGAWVGDFKCLPVCKEISSIENGEIINKPSYVAGSSIVFACNEGFNMKGDSPLVCMSDGSWRSDLPICEIVNCGEFGSVPNGQTTQVMDAGGSNVYGNKIKVTCNDGYVLSGHPEVQCRADGKWDSKPVCLSSSCGSHFGSNSSCIYDADLSPDGSILSYICMSPSSNISVTKVGSGTPVCSDGAWDEPDTGCFCDCKILENSEGVKVMDLNDGGFLKHGKKLNWTCQSGYRKENISDIVCIDGKCATPTCIGLQQYDKTMGTTNSTSARAEPLARAGTPVLSIVLSVTAIVCALSGVAAFIFFKRVRKRGKSEKPEPTKYEKDRDETLEMIPRPDDRKSSKGIVV